MFSWKPCKLFMFFLKTLLFANFFEISCPFFPLSNCFSICRTKGIFAVGKCLWNIKIVLNANSLLPKRHLCPGCCLWNWLCSVLKLALFNFGIGSVQFWNWLCSVLKLALFNFEIGSVQFWNWLCVFLHKTSSQAILEKFDETDKDDDDDQDDADA